MNLSQELLLIFLLTLVNGFFAAAEISVFSVRRMRLQELSDEGVNHHLAAARLVRLARGRAQRRRVLHPAV